MILLIQNYGLFKQEHGNGFYKQHRDDLFNKNMVMLFALINVMRICANDFMIGLINTLTWWLAYS